MPDYAAEFLEKITDENLINSTDKESYCVKFRNKGGKLIEHLLKSGISSKDHLTRIYADQLSVSAIDLTKTIFQHEAVQMIPDEFARRHNVIAVYKFGEKLTLATSAPSNKLMLEEAEAAAGCSVSPVFSLPSEIIDAIDIQYKSKNEVQNSSSAIDGLLLEDEKQLSIQQLKTAAGDEAVISFCREVILLALKERVSDIHIQPLENCVKIRFRIDGVLQDRLRLEVDALAPVISCLKVMAGVDIMERRRPQDGRITFQMTNRSIDLRFSCIPTVEGEKVVMRVLGQINRTEVPDLEELDFSKNTLRAIESVVNTPNGVFFVTGPTGSGKTTTLYAALKRLNKPGTNIITVEDPVEYRLPGLSQVQVNHEIGLDFSSALRSFLRQDPDVILVGEVRDMETARITSQAALTGHLVLSTMHTNNALQAVTRLVEIGVEPFLVAPSIIAVMAQRLVRKICSYCIESYELAKEDIDRFFICEPDEKVTAAKGKGCENCAGTGYSGRMGIHEIFMLNDEIRHLIAKESSVLDIEACAEQHGFKPLEYDGLKKVLRQQTTIEEIERVAASN
ncbi:MAG: GspE/PulE family protein [Planctomycetota bacterium]